MLKILILQATVSNERVKKFLVADEIDSDTLNRSEDGGKVSKPS